MGSQRKFSEKVELRSKINKLLLNSVRERNTVPRCLVRELGTFEEFHSEKRLESWG